MEKAETVEEFYKRINHNTSKLSLHNVGLGLGHFNIFPRAFCSPHTNYSRRDYYKVSYIIGTGKLYYANQWIHIDRPALMFSNPMVPYLWEAESPEQSGWFCLFTEDFIQHDERILSLQDSPLFKAGARPVYFLNEDQQEEISSIFRKMQQELHSDYVHKFNVLRNYLHLVIHEAMKWCATDRFEKPVNASVRITNLFLDLLERQFPIDAPDLVVQLRSPKSFAHQLSVHVNHLNRSVREVTGKTTTGHISDRILKEAVALLRHSDWNISEIAYSLGFEYPAHFTSFYKKKTGQSPAALRKSIV
ncbi:helix-turn-helix domain-containing protein [Niabella beijingensis]|uniref:helix-turn-helix domain-containing protein n=1 Tax=Niabella beijingensis TaxID=2872700 RepID=UPI001CBF443D|nr:helix-turn-helix domain-containing protein [Niabella beijingensis]MBZ4189964.1 helix-turn-helix domain-containing protein [Niabella beijingensis]